MIFNTQDITNLTTDKEELSFISRYLMLHGSFTRNLGLMNGKMGYVLFFYHYAKYTKKSIYRKFAKELLMEIYDEINNAYPCNFCNGLCGIAWSLTYLIRNGFVSSDNEQELLSDLDAKIMEWNIRLIHDISLETGILGIGHYILSRYNSKERLFYLPPDYIRDYFEVARQNNIMEIIQIMFDIESGQLTHKEYFNNILLYRSFRKYSVSPQRQEKNILVNGEAGRGLRLMLGGDITIGRNKQKQRIECVGNDETY